MTICFSLWSNWNNMKFWELFKKYGAIGSFDNKSQTSTTGDTFTRKVKHTTKPNPTSTVGTIAPSRKTGNLIIYVNGGELFFGLNSVPKKQVLQIVNKKCSHVSEVFRFLSSIFWRTLNRKSDLKYLSRMLATFGVNNYSRVFRS